MSAASGRTRRRSKTPAAGSASPERVRLPASLGPGRPLQTFFESALDAVLIVDDDGRYVEANPAACELFGLHRSEIVGRRIQDFSGPNVDAGTRLETIRDDGRSSEIVLVHRPDGGIREVESAATADVLPGLHLSILRDVTARRRAERELERRVRELQRIYDLANAVSRAASLDEIYLEALDALTGVLGADRGSVLLFDPDGVMRFKASKGISAAYQKRVEGHSPWTAESKNPQPVLVEDVTREPTLATLSDVIVAEGIRALGFIPLLDEERLLGKLMIYYDAPHRFSPEEVQLAETVARHVAFVISRKRAEEALRVSEGELSEFFENASIPIHWVGPDGTILRVNRAELELLGYDRDEYVGRNIGDFHADRRVIDDLLARLAAGEELDRYSATLRAKDGSIRRVLIDSSVYFRNGQFIHTRCFTRDVTELVRAEARQEMHFAVTRVLEEAGTLSEAAPRLIAAICETLGWDVGGVWMVDRRSDRIRAVDVWHAPGPEARTFETASRAMGFPPGVGMPGRVWASGRPAWIGDLAADSNFSRAPEALLDGLRSGCGFPITSRGEVIGVIEFFSREPRAPDEELMSALVDLGSRIGQFAERRRAQEALAEREESYRALFHVNPLPLWLVDPETLAFLAVNDAAVRVYGYSREEFLRMKAGDLLSRDGAEWPRPGPDAGDAPWNGGVATHVKKDGSVIHVEVSSHDVTLGGRPLRLALAHEVTETLRVRERERFLAEASAILGSSLDYQKTLGALAHLAVPRMGDWCLIDLLDAQGNPTRVAVAHADPQLEMVPRQYPINPSAPFGVHHVVRTGESEFVPAVSEEMLDAISWNPEHARLLKTLVGSYLCVPLNARGRMLGAMTLMRSPEAKRYDARDLTQAEELARRAALAVDNARLFAEAKEASAQKSRFLSAVSHDLRTPANAITLLSSLIRKEAEQPGVASGPRLVDRCRRLETAATSFADLLSDLLEIGSFDSGQKKLREELFPLSEVIEEAVATCGSGARQKGLDLRVRWMTSAVMIRADRTQLSRVLLNLVSNGVKFTQSGFVEIEIVGTGSGGLLIRVRDSGPGIPPEHLPSVFSEFFQVRNPERDRNKGSGLGLAISKRIMHAFGGSLHVESELGVGSVFTAALPPERIAGSSLPGGHESSRSAAPENSPVRPASILVIDDDSVSREALTVLLGDEGYRVRTAAGGAEGLRAVAEGKPDVLLLDMMMPGMDGLEVIGAIRRDPQLESVRIVALTGDVTRERLQKVLESGADRFLAKPFRIPALLDVLRTILSRRP